MNILQVSAEVAPWSKTGGLGDVCGALPKALAARGHRVVGVAPRYQSYEEAWDTRSRARFYLFGQSHEVGFFHAYREGVHRVFVDHPSFHRPGVYGDSQGAYSDNLFRFALLSRAAMEVPLVVPLAGEGGGVPLGEDVVFHANDWHTSFVPLYLEAVYRPAGRYRRAASVLGLHNLGHHGTAPAHQFAGLDVSSRWWPATDWSGNLNPLKTGIALAHKLVAVSPSYAREITEDLGFGLEGLLHARRGDLYGILNGVDAAWSPTTDPHIAAHYSADDLTGKAACKAALQQELGLPVRADVPLLAVIARLDAQKGIDLLIELLPWLLAQDVQLAVLGSGSPQLADALRAWEGRAPRKFRAWIGFNEPLSHRIEAGADIFLMPSRFEPCGLNQLYSMRYGTLPIVHGTGGLQDTVESLDGSGRRGTGWVFRPARADAFQEALRWSLYTWWNHPDAWRAAQRRAMQQDFSWERAAGAYERVYQRALEGVGA